MCSLSVAKENNIYFVFFVCREEIEEHGGKRPKLEKSVSNGVAVSTPKRFVRYVVIHFPL